MSKYSSWRQAKFQMERGKVYSCSDGDWDYYEIGKDGRLYGYASCSADFIRIEGEALIRAIHSEWYWIADESYMRQFEEKE